MKKFKCFEKARNYYHVFKTIKRYEALRAGRSYEDFCAAELIRHTHSIEKGLSIKKPRLGFGHTKLEQMVDLINILKDGNDIYHREACIMAVSAISSYIAYHNSSHYRDKMIEYLQHFLDKTSISVATNYGGVIDISKDELQINSKDVEKIFMTRHSIRDFDTTLIDNDNLKAALQLAQRAPSACNRQGYRVYVLSIEKSTEYAKKLSGIGGFENAAMRYLIITGKTSAYRFDETFQYIVSASIYAAYLTLTLHIFGMGGVPIQRPVIWDEDWNKTQKEFGIPEDEQSIVAMAIGNLKDKVRVPVSHRLDPKIMFKFVE